MNLPENIRDAELKAREAKIEELENQIWELGQGEDI